MLDSPKLYNPIIKNRNLTVGAKALYFYILVGAEGGNINFQTRNKIAYDLNISNQTLGKYLKELTQSGYIRKHRIMHDNNFLKLEFII